MDSSTPARGPRLPFPAGTLDHASAAARHDPQRLVDRVRRVSVWRGALLKNPTGEIVRYFAVVWDGTEAEHLDVKIDDPAFQTFWEFCTLLLALITWGSFFTKESVVIYGDNTAALSNALSLKGRGVLLHVAREVAWRQAKRGWNFETAHLPSEHNAVADALSRIADPKGKQWPSLALGAAEADSPPRLSELWLARPV